tara:strand:+ start:1111 stop:1335 length:225 start_codon:yes stop_codon:yes gene_type:complete
MRLARQLESQTCPELVKIRDTRNFFITDDLRELQLADVESSHQLLARVYDMRVIMIVLCLIIDELRLDNGVTCV